MGMREGEDWREIGKGEGEGSGGRERWRKVGNGEDWGNGGWGIREEGSKSGEGKHDAVRGESGDG